MNEFYNRKWAKIRSEKHSLRKMVILIKNIRKRRISQVLEELDQGKIRGRSRVNKAGLVKSLAEKAGVTQKDAAKILILC